MISIRRTGDGFHPGLFKGIGQIVLSTHEEAKAALLRYKFKHAGMSVREQNMQALYMKTVTEE